MAHKDIFHTLLEIIVKSLPFSILQFVKKSLSMFEQMRNYFLVNLKNFWWVHPIRIIHKMRIVEVFCPYLKIVLELKKS